MKLETDQICNTPALLDAASEVIGEHGQAQGRTYLDQVKYWSEFTVMWLWHNDRLQSARSQTRYLDVWMDFFGVSGRFDEMPFRTDAERAMRIASVIGASRVRPWIVDARTANAYKVRLQRRIHTVGRRPVAGKNGRQLRPDTRADKALSPKTVSNAISVMSSYYRKAAAYPIYKDGVEAMLFDRVNPFDSVSRAKFEILFEREGMSLDEVGRMLGVIPRNTGQGAMHFAMLTTYVLTGRRNSEVRTAKYGDFQVDNDGRVWQTWRGKHHVEGKRDEVAPAVWDAILHYLSATGRINSIMPGDYIFTAMSDRAKRFGHKSWEPGKNPLSISEVNRIFQMYLRRANIHGKYCVHSLRHSLAEQMLEDGARIDEVQRQLGHRNVATTLIYTSRKVHKMSDSVNRIWDKIGINGTD